MIDMAVVQREAHSVEVAKAKTAVNLALGRHRVSPKKAERVGAIIYFNVSFIFCNRSINNNVFYRLIVMMVKLTPFRLVLKYILQILI